MVQILVPQPPSKSFPNHKCKRGAKKVLTMVPTTHGKLMDDVTFLEDDSTWALLTRDHLTSLDKMMKCGQPSKETKEEIL